MTPRAFNTGAVVTLTLEIPAQSSWSESTTIDQVRRQATTDAVGTIEHYLRPKARVRIIGKPVVRIVTVEDAQ